MTVIKSIQTEYYSIELLEATDTYIVGFSNEEDTGVIDNIKDMNMALKVFDFKLSLLQGH